MIDRAIPDQKVCLVCRETKLRREFYPASGSRRGSRNVCRGCYYLRRKDRPHRT